MRSSPRSILAFLLFVATGFSGVPHAQHRLQPVTTMRGEPALELHAPQARYGGDLHDDDGASRRREQRDAGVLRARHGLPHRAGGGDTRRGRPERDRSRAVRSAGGAADRGAAGGASLRRRRAVLHPRGGLRLLVQRRRDPREVGQAGDSRRLRAHDPDHTSRRDRRLRLRRRRRRAASPGFVAAHRRGVPRRGRRQRLPRADPRGRAAAVAGRRSSITPPASALRRPRPGRGAPPTAPRACCRSRRARRYDPLLGRTFNEVGAEARSMHKCQGMSQLLPLPASEARKGSCGPRGYRLHDTVLLGGVDREDRDPFDGVDTSLASLAGYAGAGGAGGARRRSRPRRGQRWPRRARRWRRAGPRPRCPRWSAACQPCASCATDWPPCRCRPTPRYEIAHRLSLKDAQFAEALLLAAGVQLDAVARDGLVVRGQDVAVDLLIANRSGTIPVMISRRDAGRLRICRQNCARTTSCCAARKAGPPARSRRRFRRMPGSPPHTSATPRTPRAFVVDPDVPPGLPFRPTPFTATFVLNIAGADVTTTLPVQFRSEGNIFSGEKRAELHVVPRFAVTAAPQIAVVPLGLHPGHRAGHRA